MKKQVFTLLAGMALGMALLSGGYAAGTVLTAKPSSQPIYVNGQRIQMEAYSIHGNNFVKLRDIGRAVDFGVTYDAASNSVRIDPNARYQEEVSNPAPAASIPSITEESVLAVLETLENRYPNNTNWPSPYRSTSNGPYGMASSNCAGWATLCSDTAFGNLPWRKIKAPNWAQLRIGDLVQYNNEFGRHVVVVVEKTDEYIIATESTTTQKAYWGAQYFRWWLEEQAGVILYTRYPK